MRPDSGARASTSARSREGLVSSDTLDRARRLDGLSLCARCLGRPFAKIGFGLGNDERGREIAAALPRPLASETDCESCFGVFLDLEEYVRLGTEALAGIEYATFLVGTRVDADVEAAQEAILGLARSATSEPVTSELNREIGKRLEPRVGKRVDVRRPDVTVIVDTRFNVAALQIAPLFLYGRYRKLVRDIPQARWPCRKCKGSGCDACGRTGKQYATSVQELIEAPAIAAGSASCADFHGMGREDIDARCLGTGRPFVLELREPRIRTIDLARLSRAINESAVGRVEVDGLRTSNRDEVVRIKTDRACKTYRARILFEIAPETEKLKKGIAALPALAIAQRTPSRVEHRRAMLVRERRVIAAELESQNGREAVVRLQAEAGLYVKELVSGDDGRTSPSLSELLGVPARVVELDVVDVEETPRPAAHEATAR